jgi:hypothetical protein
MFLYLILAIAFIIVVFQIISYFTRTKTKEEIVTTRRFHWVLSATVNVIPIIVLLITTMISIFEGGRVEQFNLQGFINVIFSSGPSALSVIPTEIPSDGSVYDQALDSAPTEYTSTVEINQAVVYNQDPADRLNLRTRPNSGSDTIGKYYSGVVVEILEYTNDTWIKAKLPNDRVGYMMRDFLRFDHFQNVSNACPTYSVKHLAVKLYASPSSKSSRIYPANQADDVQVIGVYNDWWHVNYAGTYGFMVGLESLWQRSK